MNNPFVFYTAILEMLVGIRCIENNEPWQGLLFIIIGGITALISGASDE